jgi:hypothetical protein
MPDELIRMLRYQLLYPGRPRHPVHLLEPNELLRMVEGLRVWRYEETWEGRGTAAVIARKAEPRQ